jgi:hypothetical protein
MPNNAPTTPTTPTVIGAVSSLLDEHDVNENLLAAYVTPAPVAAPPLVDDTELSFEAYQPTSPSLAKIALTDNMFKEDGEVGDALERLDIATCSAAEFQHNFNSAPNDGNFKPADEWVSAVSALESNGHNLTITGAAAQRPDFEAAFDDKDGDWNQTIVAPNGLLPVATRLSTPKGKGTSLTGSDAIRSFNAQLSIGKPATVLLPRSMFWISFNVPSEAAWAELYRELASDTIAIGRYTHSLAYSNLSAYTIERYLRFALRHMNSSTVFVKNATVSDMMALIDLADVYTILAAILSTRYPDGIPHRRACVASPATCNHVATGTLNLLKCIVTNDAALDTEDRAFLSVRTANAHAVERVKEMRERRLKRDDFTAEIVCDNGAVFIVKMKMPTALEYVEAGRLWIEGMAENIPDAIEGTEKGAQRATYLTDRTKASLLRSWSHMVDVIYLPNTDFVDDPESVREILASLSSDDKARAALTKAITQFRDTRTINVVGVATFKCPNCSKLQPSELPPPHMNILPLDVPRIFFTMLLHRVRKIAGR